MPSALFRFRGAKEGLQVFTGLRRCLGSSALLGASSVLRALGIVESLERYWAPPRSEASEVVDSP